MTIWRICFRVPKLAASIDGKNHVCVEIPLIVPVPGRPGPGPGPEPFLTHPGFGQEKVRHLQTLATIDQVAAELPVELSRDILRSVAAHMQSLGHELGADIELSRHTPQAKA